jgi:transcriptional regulator with XRE-family HTH domain
MDKLYFEEKGPGILDRIGMSKAEFARRMGVKRQNVNALFKSKKNETIRQAADVMGVPFEMLIGYTSERDLPVGYPASDCVPGAELLPDIPAVSSRIRVIRGVQIILDRDLAPLYQVEVGQMNRQVKRNITRFPEDFMFQLTRSEYDALKCQNGISNTRGGDRSLPYAFTEQGVSMLSGLLRSDVAIQVNILIMRAFVSLRRGLVAGASLKDLGKKWFALSKMEDLSPGDLLSQM